MNSDFSNRGAVLKGNIPGARNERDCLCHLEPSVVAPGGDEVENRVLVPVDNFWLFRDQLLRLSAILSEKAAAIGSVI
jgi:hypothetical protein